MLRTIRVLAAATCLALTATAAAAQQPAAPTSDAAGDAEAATEAVPEAGEEPAPLTEEEMEKLRAEFDARLHHKTGRIAMTGDGVTLNVPEAFYYLDAADSAKVLEDAWGNPPDKNVKGMLFPAGMSPLAEDAWGVVLTFEKSGYVPDEDAAGLDYDMLIAQMRDSMEAENLQRKQQGYPSIEIVGWAAQPRYDAKTHKLYWAKELKFEDSPNETLNYDMRVLGRYGVLSMNFVASLEQLPAVEAAAPAMLKVADFDAGSRYEDFNASTDAQANYGVAGLIGGAAAAAALAKNGGILAAVLLFLKKGFVIILAGIGAIGAAIRSFFSRKSKAEVKAEQRSATAFFDGPAAEPPAAPATDDQAPPSAPPSV